MYRVLENASNIELSLDFESIYEHGENITQEENTVNKLVLPNLYEDLLRIGIGIFALDSKPVNRNAITYNLTKLNIPVSNSRVWNMTTTKWNKLMYELTGNIWEVDFYDYKNNNSVDQEKSAQIQQLDKCDCVCIFDGRMNEFFYASELLNKGKSPCVIDFDRHPHIENKIVNIIELLKEEYHLAHFKHIKISTKTGIMKCFREFAYTPDSLISEGTALLHLCLAVTVAGLIGEKIPVYVAATEIDKYDNCLKSVNNCITPLKVLNYYCLEIIRDILETVGIHNPICKYKVLSKNNGIAKYLYEIGTLSKKGKLTQFELYDNVYHAGDFAIEANRKLFSPPEKNYNYVRYSLNCAFEKNYLFKGVKCTSLKILKKVDDKDILTRITMQNDATPSIIAQIYME
jgi:hypothetical protein